MSYSVTTLGNDQDENEDKGESKDSEVTTDQ